MVRVCAITNVYNEAFNLPIWLRYYSTQIGAENCIVVDHGSDDGSTARIEPSGIIRLPRGKFDDHARARTISGIASSLLNFYDFVIYSDCDEMLVADPRAFRNLAEYCQAMTHPAVTAVGFNVVHVLNREDPVSIGSPLLAQRRFVQFVSPMCKTLLTRRPITWGGGFHSSNHPPLFDQLFLLHLRWCDMGQCLSRLSTTRKIEFRDSVAGKHQRSDYLDYVRRFTDLSEMPISESFDFGSLLETLKSSVEEKDGLYRFNRDVRSSQLYSLPEEFVGLF